MVTPFFSFFGDLGNGLTRLPWKQETPGSSPGSPTSSLTISHQLISYQLSAIRLEERLW